MFYLWSCCKWDYFKFLFRVLLVSTSKYNWFLYVYLYTTTLLSLLVLIGFFGIIFRDFMHVTSCYLQIIWILPLNLDAFTSFSCLISLARTSSTIWIKAARDILVLFLIMEEKLADFPWWVYLWAWCVWPLLGWGNFLLFLVC